MIARSPASVKVTCLLGEAVVLHLLGHQVIARDRELLLLGVAGQLEHFHAVAQRPGNRVEHVGGGDEQHLGQVERHVQVVIAEGVVLLRVEHLEQRRRRIAAEVGAELVDLVEDEDRVLRLGAAQPLDDLAGQRADVGAAVAADLGLVAHAAERDAHELAAERLRRSSGPARSCRRPAGRRSTGSAPSAPGSACAPPGTRGCGPSPCRARSARRRARPSCVGRSMTSSVRLLHGSATSQSR